MEMEQKPQYSTKTQWSTSSACPPGLEYLTQIDSLTVRGSKDGVHRTTRTTKLTYEFRNNSNQRFMHADEHYQYFQQSCCSSGKVFETDVANNVDGRNVLRFRKELKSGEGWCCLVDSCNCAPAMNIELPTGELIGIVREAQATYHPGYHVLNGDNQPILYIKDSGPCCCLCECCSNFKVYTMDRKHTIGSVSRLFERPSWDMQAEADLYVISFPMDLDVKAKATLIGAAFMIEYRFFAHETPQV